MLDEIRKYADGYIECSSSAGIPQELWAADEPIDGARLEGGKLRNYYYPSPIMHVQAAAALAPLCNRYLSRRITAASQQPAIAPSGAGADAIPYPGGGENRLGFTAHAAGFASRLSCRS